MKLFQPLKHVVRLLFYTADKIAKHLLLGLNLCQMPKTWTLYHDKIVKKEDEWVNMASR